MLWLSAALAYVIGSIPFGVIVARVYGVDLRTKGSGNIGATNALRVIGKKAGVLTLVGDVLKGTLAVYIALQLAGRDAALLAAGFAVFGHDFSVFTGLKGGKGVATTFGVLLVLEPFVALLTLTAWLAIVALWRYSSLGALVSFLLLPVFSYVVRPGEHGFIVLALFLSGLAVFKHRSNITRLVRGEESRIGGKPA